MIWACVRLWYTHREQLDSMRLEVGATKILEAAERLASNHPMRQASHHYAVGSSEVHCRFLNGASQALMVTAARSVEVNVLAPCFAPCGEAPVRDLNFDQNCESRQPSYAANPAVRIPAPAPYQEEDYSRGYSRTRAMMLQMTRVLQNLKRADDFVGRQQCAA